MYHSIHPFDHLVPGLVIKFQKKEIQVKTFQNQIFVNFLETFWLLIIFDSVEVYFLIMENAFSAVLQI